MAEGVPITFEYKGRKYSGFFHPVAGTGQPWAWQLLLDDYFYGNLRYADQWVFEGQQMQDLGDFFGSYITAWYE